jgi:hypothetical protein
MNHIAAEAEIVPAQRPREGVSKLHLMTKDVGGTRLPTVNGTGAAAGVGSGEILSLPQCDRIAMQVGKSRFV